MQENGLREIFIIGGGDFAKEIAETIAAINKASATFLLAGFIDDDPKKSGAAINGTKVLGCVDDFIRMAEGRRPSAVLGVADPDSKRSLVERLEGRVAWETLVHPSAIISPYAAAGSGCVVQQGANIAPNAALGIHCHINVGSSIGHDVSLGDYSSVMINASVSGHNTVGESVFISSGVVTVPGITIGGNSYIGAGATVTKDLPGGILAYGSPCRVIRKREAKCDTE